MVRGGPADLGHFVHSSHTSPDETRSSHGFKTRMMPVDTGTRRRRTYGMCRRTHGIARMSHGSARNNPYEPRKCPEKPERPRNAPVEPGSEKYGDLPGCFKQFQTSGNEQGLSRNSPELQGFTMDLPRRSTDYPRTTQDQAGVARIGGPWRSGPRSGKV